MADATITKVALAGLLHDIGKIAQGCLEITSQYRRDNEDIYQPKYDGRPSHVHALYTAAFIEQNVDFLPPELTARQWGEGEVEDTLLNLAACHHNPRTPLQWIVAVADRIASGLDRATFAHGEAIAYKDFRRTRLLPVLESLGPQKSQAGGYRQAADFTCRYPLAPLGVASMFPLPAKIIDAREGETDYRELFDRFRQRLAGLEHRRDNVQLWAEHFDSLFLTFASLVPAARVGDVVHDVSLYDHSRTTAALAAALYRYHRDSDTLNEKAIRDGSSEKLLLVSGDFYGIQDFIFSGGGESRKFRSKLLRGRSFAVSLFSELAADLLCRELKLPFVSVVLNAAGKFHLLAPNRPATREAIVRAEQLINDWLFAVTFGQSSMGISCTAAAPDDFHAGRFAAFWERHLFNLEERKFNKVDLDRHGGAVPMVNYLDRFINDDKLVRRPLCPLCGKRPASRETENDRVFGKDETSSCRLCRDHVFLGKNLVKNPRVAVLAARPKGSGDDNRDDHGLRLPIFGRYQICFSNDGMEKDAVDGTLLKLWQVKAEADGSLPAGVTLRLLNGHVPLYRDDDNHDNCLLAGSRTEENILNVIDQIAEGVPKTFTHIALKARHQDQEGKCRGVEALGVLKADIDHLGMLFGCGLPSERFTLSRLATISRQLNNFFVLHLPHLLAEDARFRDVYTVFAGGDDLFLVGPWNRMAELASRLREDFSRYVAGNPEITFSAGITVHKPHVPVDKLAQLAEEALAAAKGSGRNRVTMFGETVTWADFAELLASREVMEQWPARKIISEVMFYRFNHFIVMSELEQRLLAADSVAVADMDCLKWRALCQYSLARNTSKKCTEQERKEPLQMVEWLANHRGALRIPLWHVLYEKRK